MNEYEKFLAEAKAKLAVKAEKLAKKKVVTSSEVSSPPQTSSADKRLTFVEVKEVYQQTQLVPSRSFYFFKPDRPLLFASHVSSDGKQATPFGALCIAHKAPFIQEPPEEWYTPRVGSFLGFTSSYVLGFNNGFDGNAPGHPRCSEFFHQGYRDGAEIFAAMLNENLIEDIKHEPVHMTDDQLLDFYRVTGEWTN